MLSIGGSDENIVIARFEHDPQRKPGPRLSRLKAGVRPHQVRAGFFRIKLWLDDTIEKRSHDRP